jgi:sigma-B regulation protein RsbU (phosphoserine phosphatase)
MTQSGDPAAAMTEVNRFLATRSATTTFASLWVGVLERGSTELRYVDAGHGHWTLKRHDGAAASIGRPEGLLIGIQSDFAYETQTIDVHDGDRIVLFSDGMIEQRSPAGEEFGLGRLLEALADAPGPDEDVAVALEALRGFIGGAPFEDDTTIASILVGAAAE